MDSAKSSSNLYSVRQRSVDGSGQADVYQYDVIPPRFRAQVVHIWSSAIGPWSVEEEFVYDNFEEDHTETYVNPFWSAIYATYSREVGLLDLPGGDAFNRLKGFFLGEATTIDCLDLIDLTFRTIDGDVRACWSHALQHEGAHFGEDNNGPYRDTSVPNGLAITQEPNDAIEELNRRFQQHGIGYRYGSHQLFRVDSQYAHHEIVRPALTLLQDVAFSGASEEFLRAHEHYRQGRNKEAIVEAEKAFESTLKTICDRLEWPYDPRSGAQALIKVIIDQHLVDGILQSFLSGLRAMLESGLPPIRNNIAAHGQGSRPMDVPDHLAAFALHSAATSILMLIHAYQLRMPRTSQPDVMNEP